MINRSTYRYAAFSSQKLHGLPTPLSWRGENIHKYFGIVISSFLFLFINLKRLAGCMHLLKVRGCGLWQMGCLHLYIDIKSELDVVVVVVVVIVIVGVQIYVKVVYYTLKPIFVGAPPLTC
jgi:hypothetical protein